jgi:hypothetical protein
MWRVTVVALCLVLGCKKTAAAVIEGGADAPFIGKRRPRP